MREGRRTLPPVRGLEPWLALLGLLSLGTSGVAPMLMPLEIVEIEGKALHVGAVMAAIGAGLLTAPLWNQLANRRRAHRSIIVGGSLAIAVSLAGFCLAREVHEWGALAILMGAGVAAVFTVANVIVGERYPAAEQPSLYGWMQTLTTVGTVFGLLLAGVVNHLALEPEVGFAIAGALALAAALLAPVVIPPALAARPSPRPVGVGLEPGRPPVQAMPVLPGQPAESLRPFATLLTLWMTASLGLNAVGALYPLLMRQEFHIRPAVSSYFLAVTTVVQAMLYLPASGLSARRGELRVLQGGFGLRLVSLVLLAILGAMPFLQPGWLAFLPYAVCVLAWPLLNISSGLLATRLNASGVGLFTASGALASLAGPVIGGHAADTFGYTSVWLLAAGGVALALLLTLALARPVAAIRELSPDPRAAGSGAT